MDAEMLAQTLDILDQVPGGVLFERGMRRRPAAAALIEQHDAIAARIVIAAHHRVDAAARAAMQQNGGLAGGRAAFLEIDLVQVRDSEPSRTIGHDLGIEREPRLMGSLLPVHRLHRSASHWPEAVAE